MKKIFICLLILLSLMFTSCDLFPVSCSNFKNEPQSWGTKYTWTSKDSQGELIFYTYLEPDSPIYGKSSFYIQGPIDMTTFQHKYVQEFENPEVKNFEKINGQIKSITINNKKYINKDL